MIRKDWRFTEDGDIELGPPKTNDQGQLLYINRFGEVSTDPAEGGHLISDIPLFIDVDAMKQVVKNRIRTDAPDWMLHPKMGGNLSDLVGEPNTRATGEKGEALLREAILYQGFISSEALNVRAVPVNPETILFYIEIKEETEVPVAYPVLFNLEHGILSEYEVKA